MDLIDRQQVIDAIWDIEDDPEVISIIKSLPSAQKTGHWIDKPRGEQKNSECSECHTLFRVLIHDYPYCPCCGSRNRGEENE